jgi:hypothetical protein
MLKNVTDDILKYCLVVASLPHDVLWQVADLLDIDKLERPYMQLKERLMSTHELTPVQRAERVMQMPDLGAQLLAAMLEWCLRGEETLSFFIASFLRPLPNKLCVLLGHDDFSDMKAISQQADAFWQLCPRADLLAAVSEAVEEAGAAAAD